MEVSTSLVLPVTEPSEAGEARRRALRMAETQGLGEVGAGKVALLATEMAGNLVKHTARGGHLLLQEVSRGDSRGVELMALDRGPGMRDVARCLADGYSTAGSPGTGLGAVTRMADEWDLHSLPKVGTALLARVWTARPAPDATALGGVSVPKPGQEACGDGWAAHRAGPRTVLVVSDGLGHGPDAAEASREALRVFRERPGDPPAELLEAMHDAMRGTRGAAVAVALADAAEETVRFAGVGNISGTVVAAGTEARSTVSHAGIVGHEARRFQEFSYAWPAGALLVLHSDGVNTRWNLDRLAGLASRDPALVAGVLYRDFCRGTDDATVAVLRAPVRT